jgi:MFS family permease
MPRAVDPLETHLMTSASPVLPADDQRQRAAIDSGERGWRGRLRWMRFNRSIWILLFFTLGKGFQISIGAVTINLYVYSLGYKEDFVGLFAGMSAIAALLMAIPAGMISDRLGRRPVMLISGLITPFTLVAIAFSTSVPALLISAFLNGIFASFYWVTTVPMLAESVGENERVGVLALNSFLLLGVGALGSLIGGFVPEVAALLVHQPATHPLPLRLGVLSAAVIVSLAAIPLFWLRPVKPEEVQQPQTQPGEVIPANTQTGAQPERQARSLVLLFAMLLIPDALITFGEGMVVGLMQLFFFLKFGLQPGTLGGLFTVAGLLGGLAGLGAPLLVKRWGKLRTATGLQLATAPAMLITGFAPWLPLAAGAEYTRAMMRAFIDPVYSAFAIEQLPEDRRATLFGAYSVTWGLGFSLGPSLGGWLQEHISLSATFVVGAICLTIAPTMLLLFFGRRKGATK